MAAWQTVRAPHHSATQGALLVQATLTPGDATADWLVLPARADVLVQVSGNFGSGGSITIEGSNQPAEGSPVAFALRPADAPGTQLSAVTAAEGRQLLDHPYMIRARATAGSGYSIVVDVFASSAREF